MKYSMELLYSVKQDLKRAEEPSQTSLQIVLKIYISTLILSYLFVFPPSRATGCVMNKLGRGEMM